MRADYREKLFKENPKERGVSFDQDGKSNTWAIEPKIKVDDGSKKTNPFVVTGSVIGVLGVVGAVCANLPDPDSL